MTTAPAKRPHLHALLADAEYELRQAARIFDSLRRLKGDEGGELERLVARQVGVAERLKAAGGNGAELCSE